MRSLVRRTTVIACLLVAFGSCAGDGGFPVGEGDHTSSAGLTIDETLISASVLAGNVNLELPLTRDSGSSSLTGVAEVTLYDLAGNEVDHQELDFLFPEGDTSTDLYFEGLEGVPEGTSGGDLAQYVVRYRVSAGSAELHGRRSLFMVAQRIGAVVLGTDELYDDQPAHYRVLAQDPNNGNPLAETEIEVLLETTDEDGEATQTQVWEGVTDEAGIAAVRFSPQDIAGPASMIVRMAHEEHTSESRHSVIVMRDHRVLLTTDKPMYQPGQLIHLRALSLRLPDNQASAGADVTFEIMDARGNLVFRQEETANDFGVASAQFRLARMVNMGRYTIRAIVDDAIQERTVTVDRYSLPRFRIGFDSDQSFYLPGETLRGEVDVDYTFGQPVAGGSVTINASQFDVDWVSFAELRGTTDDEGNFAFELELPSYFVGLPVDQGGSFVKLNIEVTDTAGQVFEIERGITVSQGAVTAVLIPERPALAPGVENTIFLLTSDPTGTPIATRCDVRIGAGAPIAIETDERGYASFDVTPEAGVALGINVEIDDGRGGVVNLNQSFSTDGTAADTVLLRTDQSLYEVGDRAEVQIWSPRPQDRVYLDVVHAGQTLLTDIVTVEEGWTTVNLDLTDALSGSLTLSVYYIAGGGEIIRDQRVVFVSGAAELALEMDLDLPVYRPAETATLSLRISDSAGEGVQSAIGLQVVDEAVFALSEQQPGLERIYFQLEEELAQPAYEIHGFDAGSVLGDGDPAIEDPRTQEAARVLFATGAGIPLYDIDFSSERELTSVVLSHAVGAVNADINSIIGRLQSSLDSHRFGEPEDHAEDWIERTQEFWYDPWGQQYQSTFEGSNLTLVSAGVDETWGTADDITANAWVDLWSASRGGDGDWFAEDDENAMPGAGDWDGAEADGDVDGDGDGDVDPSDGHSGGGGDGPRIRTWFPETLYVDPSIITDEDGRATVEIPLADSITTWRASATASSRRGHLGSSTTGITVFQEFFVDLALPATMTLGDEITVPVVVYNYLDEAQTVEIEVEPEDWFTMMTPAVQTVTLEAREVSSVPLRIRTDEVGWHSLQAIGRAGDIADGLRRRIEVMPSGQEISESQSDVLQASPEGTHVAFEFDVPGNGVTGASELLVKLYPGVFAQAIEGLDSILRMPSGCFEQTSSSTYPNVMVLQYMQETGNVTPEIELQAREYISQGYQRLLTFEVTGGGFEWFGSPPAHKILTAYGLMEFSDMAQVHAVDPAVITRTAAWLAAQQEGDGSWTPDAGGIAEGAINNYQNDTYRTTAYILWALLEADYNGPEVSLAVGYLRANRDAAASAYTRAIAAQALISNDPSDAVGTDFLDQLAEDANVEDEAAYWGDEEGASGMTHSMGNAHVLETTALVADVFLRARRHMELATQALTFLVRNKDSYGNFSTTQATVYALRAMIRSIASSTTEADGTIEVFHNGELVDTILVTPEDSDVFRQLDLKEWIVEGGENLVELVMTGEGSLMYQTVGTYWMPWEDVPEELVGPMSIDVSYDRTSLEVDDTVSVNVTLTNNTSGSLMMVLIDLGIPPGFDLQTDDLDALIAAGVFRRYERAGRQLLLYFDEIGPGDPMELSYRLIARNPMRGEAPASSAYLYYEPDVRTMARPVEIEVD